MSKNFVNNFYEEYNDFYILKVQYKNELLIPVYIDKEDYERVNKIHWRASHKKNKIYIVSGQSKNNSLVYLHNFLMNYTPIPQQEIDHLDGNSCNNRKNNLKLVSRQSNIDNTRVRIDNKIGIRGVCQNSKNKLYKCDFIFHGKRYYFKDWKTCEEAVYCRKIVEEIFGKEILNKNPLAQQYIAKLTEQQKKDIKDYVYKKVS